MAISNITTPRTMSMDAMRALLAGASALLSLILTTRDGVLDPVAVVVSDMRFLCGGWNSAHRRMPGREALYSRRMFHTFVIACKQKNALESAKWQAEKKAFSQPAQYRPTAHWDRG